MNNSRQKSQVIEMYGVLCIDILCAVVSYLAALYMRFGTVSRIGSSIHAITLSCILLFYVFYASITESGRDFVARGYYVEGVILLKRTVFIAIIWGCSLFLFKIADEYSRLVFGYFIILDVVLSYCTHIVFKQYMKFYYKNTRSKTKVMVLSDYNNISRVLTVLLGKRDSYYEFTSAVVWNKNLDGTGIEGIPVVANSENIWEVARQIPLDEVFIHLPHENREMLQKLIIEFEKMGIICHYSLDVVDWNVKTRRLEEFEGFTVIMYALNEKNYEYGPIKRCMDTIGGLIGIMITVILFPFIAAAIKIDSKGPILFKQVRVGKNGRCS